MKSVIGYTFTLLIVIGHYISLQYWKNFTLPYSVICSSLCLLRFAGEAAIYARGGQTASGHKLCCQPMIEPTCITLRFWPMVDPTCIALRCRPMVDPTCSSLHSLHIQRSVQGEGITRKILLNLCGRLLHSPYF